MTTINIFKIMEEVRARKEAEKVQQKPFVPASSADDNIESSIPIGGFAKQPIETKPVFTPPPVATPPVTTKPKFVPTKPKVNLVEPVRDFRTVETIKPIKPVQLPVIKPSDPAEEINTTPVISTQPVIDENIVSETDSNIESSIPIGGVGKTITPAIPNIGASAPDEEEPEITGQESVTVKPSGVSVVSKERAEQEEGSLFGGITIDKIDPVEINREVEILNSRVESFEKAVANHNAKVEEITALAETDPQAALALIDTLNVAALNKIKEKLDEDIRNFQGKTDVLNRGQAIQIKVATEANEIISRRNAEIAAQNAANLKAAQDAREQAQITENLSGATDQAAENPNVVAAVTGDEPSLEEQRRAEIAAAIRAQQEELAGETDQAGETEVFSGPPKLRVKVTDDNEKLFRLLLNTNTTTRFIGEESKEELLELYRTRGISPTKFFRELGIDGNTINQNDADILAANGLIVPVENIRLPGDRNAPATIKNKNLFGPDFAPKTQDQVILDILRTNEEDVQNVTATALAVLPAAIINATADPNTRSSFNDEITRLAGTQFKADVANFEAQVEASKPFVNRAINVLTDPLSTEQDRIRAANDIKDINDLIQSRARILNDNQPGLGTAIIRSLAPRGPLDAIITGMLISPALTAKIPSSVAKIIVSPRNQTAAIIQGFTTKAAIIPRAIVGTADEIAKPVIIPRAVGAGFEGAARSIEIIDDAVAASFKAPGAAKSAVANALNKIDDIFTTKPGQVDPSGRLINRFNIRAGTKEVGASDDVTALVRAQQAAKEIQPQTVLQSSDDIAQIFPEVTVNPKSLKLRLDTNKPKDLGTLSRRELVELGLIDDIATGGSGGGGGLPFRNPFGPTTPRSGGGTLLGRDLELAQIINGAAARRVIIPATQSADEAQFVLKNLIAQGFVILAQPVTLATVKIPEIQTFSSTSIVATPTIAPVKTPVPVIIPTPTPTPVSPPRRITPPIITPSPFVPVTPIIDPVDIPVEIPTPIPTPITTPIQLPIEIAPPTPEPITPPIETPIEIPSIISTPEPSPQPIPISTPTPIPTPEPTPTPTPVPIITRPTEIPREIVTTSPKTGAPRNVIFTDVEPEDDFGRDEIQVGSVIKLIRNVNNSTLQVEWDLVSLGVTGTNQNRILQSWGPFNISEILVSGILTSKGKKRLRLVFGKSGRALTQGADLILSLLALGFIQPTEINLILPSGFDPNILQADVTVQI